MKPATMTAIRAVLAADETVTASEIAVVEASLAGATPAAECVRFSAAARRLGVSARTVREYARRGLLAHVRAAGRSRALGVTGASLAAMIDPPKEGTMPASEPAGLPGAIGAGFSPAAAGHSGRQA